MRQLHINDGKFASVTLQLACAYRRMQIDEMICNATADVYALIPGLWICRHVVNDDKFESRYFSITGVHAEHGQKRTSNIAVSRRSEALLQQ